MFFFYIYCQANQEEKGNEDVYNFDDDEEGGEVATEEEDDPGTNMVDTVNGRGLKMKGTKTRAKHVRPQFTCNFCSYTSHRR